MGENDFSNDDVSEMPEYSAKSEFSKAAKVAEAFSRVVEARGKEMKPGYFNFAMDKQGILQKVWVPDARLMFIGAVEALRSVLMPEIERDEKYQDAEANICEEIDELEKAYAYEEYQQTIAPDNYGNNIIQYKKTGRKFMPRIDDEVTMPFAQGNTIVGYNPIKGGWNVKVNRFHDLLVNKYDQVFAELSKVIDRINYFKSGLSF